jgi:hypothetical protein
VPDLTMSDAALLCRVHRQTVREWGKGVRLHSGEVIVLRTLRVGRRYRTSREELADFLARLNPARPAPIAAVAA